AVLGDDEAAPGSALELRQEVLLQREVVIERDRVLHRAVEAQLHVPDRELQRRATAIVVLPIQLVGRTGLGEVRSRSHRLQHATAEPVQTGRGGRGRNKEYESGREPATHAADPPRTVDSRRWIAGYPARAPNHSRRGDPAQPSPVSGPRQARLPLSK